MPCWQMLMGQSFVDYSHLQSSRTNACHMSLAAMAIGYNYFQCPNQSMAALLSDNLNRALAALPSPNFELIKGQSG